ncbi:MAG: hypothetical protein KAV00_18625, partial [Phycisphaerae bacterium]|nr:hypothetical protein [Phycisphaerae bacterium]
DVVVHEWDWNAVESEWETGRFVGLDSLVEAPTLADDMLPHAVAATITGFSEDVNTRSRKSISGFCDTRQLESNWTGATIVDLVLTAASWISLFSLGGVDSLEAVVPSKLGVAESLIATLVSTVIGSQRQRKPGEGI